MARGFGTASSGEVRVALLLIGVIAAVGFVSAGTQAHQKEEEQRRIEAPKEVNGLPNYLADAEAGAKRVEELALRCDGDVTKLSPEERQWLDAMSAGHGAVMIRKKAAYLKEQAAKKKSPKSPPKPTAGRAEATP